MTKQFNVILASQKMPEEWRKSVLVLIFKTKGDVQSCSSYRGIKLKSQTMKIWGRVKLREEPIICEQHHGFMTTKVPCLL